VQDDAILERLRSLRGAASAIAIAEELAAVRSEHSQGAFVTFFHRAFPDIPLRTLLECGAWIRLSAGELTDDEFTEMLSPWLGTKGAD
jgi:hypothetical protein